MRVRDRGGASVVAALLVAAVSAGGCSTDDPTARPVSEATEATEVIEVIEVVEVIDGDTLDVRLAGRDERVRLIGVNTPERDECLYEEAARALEELVVGEAIRLERDRSDRDQYGRLLRYVHVDDTFVNEVLVAQGLAISRSYPPDTARQPELDRAEAEARDAGRGQWAADACGQASAAADTLAIRAIEHDPPGDDSLVPNEEFVVIANEGDQAVSLAGWGLRDESSSHRFTFPDTTLDAGAQVTIHTGCGEASPSDLYWCVSGSAVWNNDGDTAFLVDPSGNIATSQSYSGE